MKLDGRRVLVTGASSGIGAEIAGLLAERGATVLATGRDSDALAVLPSAGYTAVDLGQLGAAAELARWAGEVDVFVGNAGIGYAGALSGMPEQRITELVTVNLLANLALARLLVPAMQRRGEGAVGFVASIAGVMGVGDESVYAATKAGLLGFADSLRLEVAAHGVQVNTVVPGVVDTAFFERRGARYDRARPRPVPPRAVAAALVDALERDRAEVFVPSWLRLPARLRGGAPALVRRLRRIVG